MEATGSHDSLPAYLPWAPCSISKDKLGFVRLAAITCASGSAQPSVASGLSLEVVVGVPIDT
jgi:hypothetical protein